MDKFWMKLAFFLPKKLAYWATIRLIANATQGKWSHVEAPAVLAMDVLKRWE
jgi:hypothetical protein